MERSEPSLVPQWLKNTGTQNGGGSISHSDEHPSALKIARNKSFVDNNGNDFERFLSFDKTTSSYFRRSFSSNGSGNLRSRSSFGRNQYDRDWERGTYDSHKKDKSFLGDRSRQHQDLSDSPGNTLLSNLERDGLRHSHSVSGKRGDTSCNKVATDSSTSGANTNGLLSKGSPVAGVNKITFEREFPSLGTEEKAVTSEVGRVPSPGLTSSAIQSLPMGTSTITGEKWTSALADAPVLVGVNGSGTLAVQHDAPSGPVSLPLSTSSSLNMAEAVAQGPNRAQTAPQLSVGTQRLEELAIKQSRQLIPVTPSSPKTSVLNLSDKPKTRIGQQPHPVSSQLAVNHSTRGVLVKGGDASRASSIIGKLRVLKQVREKNITAPLVKDSLNQASGSKLVNSALAGPSVSGSGLASRVPATNPGQERKSVLEKRPTLQAQSRNDFFNSVRKKSMADPSSVSDSTKGNSSSVTTESSTGSSPSVIDTSTASSVPDTYQKSNGSFVKSPGGVDHLSLMNGASNRNGNPCVQLKTASYRNKLPSSDPIFPEEEEAAFLRSLGWEENADEGGLTEEEINAFFQDVTKYINLKPSLKILQGVHPEFLLPVDSPKLES